MGGLKLPSHPCEVLGGKPAHRRDTHPISWQQQINAGRPKQKKKKHTLGSYRQQKLREFKRSGEKDTASFQSGVKALVGCLRLQDPETKAGKEFQQKVGALVGVLTTEE